MRRFLLLYFLSLRLFAGEVVDDSGQVIHLNHPAKRVISLSPDLTEILFAIGAGAQIIGVMQGSDFPSAANKIPVVASYANVNMEYVLSLHPDLIVAWRHGISDGNLAYLKMANIPVYLNNPIKIEDITTTIKNLGSLTGQDGQASFLAKKFLSDFTFLKKKYQREKKVKVFFQLSEKPLLTINKNNWINDIVALCGGENIFANTYGNAPEVSIEAVLLAKPQIILSTQASMIWGQFPSVQTKQFTVNPDWLERPTPRLLLGMRQVCGIIDSFYSQ